MVSNATYSVSLFRSTTSPSDCGSSSAASRQGVHEYAPALLVLQIERCEKQERACRPIGQLAARRRHDLELADQPALALGDEDLVVALYRGQAVDRVLVVHGIVAPPLDCARRLQRRRLLVAIREHPRDVGGGDVQQWAVRPGQDRSCRTARDRSRDPRPRPRPRGALGGSGPGARHTGCRRC